MSDIKFVVSIEMATATAAIKMLEGEFDKIKITTGAAGAETKSFGDQLMSRLVPAFTIATLAANAIQKGVRGIQDAFVGAVQGAMDEEASEIALATALEIRGKKEAGAKESLMAFAKEQMKSTIYTHEQVEAVETFLTQLTKLDTAGTKRATTGIIGLAAVMKTDLAGAMGFVQKAMEGNYGALARIGIRIDENLPKEERAAQLLDKLEKLYGRATAQAGTFAGGLTQLKNMWGEVGETLGGAIVKNEQVRDLIEEVKTKIVDLIESGKLDEWADRAAKGINLIVDAFDMFMGTVDRLSKGGQITEWLAGFISGATKAEQEYIVAGKALILGLQSSLKFVKLNAAETASALEKGADSWTTYAKRMQEIDAQLAKERAMPRFVPPGAIAEIYDLSAAMKDLAVKSTAELTKELEKAGRALKGAIVAGEAPGVIETLRKKFKDLEGQLHGNKSAWELLNEAVLLSITRHKYLEPIMEKITRTIIATDLPIARVTAHYKLLAAEMDRINKIGPTGLEKWEKTLGKISEAVGLVAGAMTATLDQAETNRTIKIENEYKKRLAYINVTVTDEDAGQKAIMALDAEYDIKRSSAARAGATQRKAVALMEATVNTATGVARALADFPFPLDLIIAGIVGAFGAVQIGLIAAQPIPMAKGGIVSRPLLLGEAGPEAVIPLRELPRLMNEIGRGGAGVGRSTEIVVHVSQTFYVQELSDGVIGRAGSKIMEVIRREARREGWKLHD